MTIYRFVENSFDLGGIRGRSTFSNRPNYTHSVEDHGMNFRARSWDMQVLRLRLVKGR
jgi:hypothetical protein